MDRLRISGPRSLAYVPQYAGMATGRFADRSIDVHLHEVQGTLEDVVGVLNRGEADLLLGSCLYGLRLSQTGIDPVVVAQLNQRTRHVIARREGAGPMDWADLRGKTIVVCPDKLPTHWAAFTYALHKAGLDLGDVKLAFGYIAEDAIAEFIRGVGDVLYIDGELAARDGLEIGLRVSAQTGNLPWSVYMADRRFIAEKRPLFARFAAALDSAQKWVEAESAETVAQAVAPFFPQFTPEGLLAMIANYKRLDMWAPQSAVQRDQLQRWSEGLRLVGFLPPGRELTDYLEILTD